MLSIGEFSKLSSVSAKTLRYYDEIDLLKPIVVNVDNNYRYYEVGQLQTILFINRLKSYGFSLEEVAAALKDKDNYPLLRYMIEQKQNQLEAKIQEGTFLIQQMKKDIFVLERGHTIMSYLDQITITTKEISDRRIFSIRERINVEQFGSYLGKLFSAVSAQNLTILGAPMSIYHSPDFNPEEFDVELAVPVLEEGEGTRILTGGLCAVGTLKGAYDGLPSVYAKLGEWLEESQYLLADSPYEVYVTDPAKVPAEEYVTEIYFPLKKR